jgi:peptide-methionine (R)-S-oxide reductase
MVPRPTFSGLGPLMGLLCLIAALAWGGITRVGASAMDEELELAAPAAAAPVRDPDGLLTPLPVSDEQWRAVLTPEQFRVLRGEGTERAFTGVYWDTKTGGVYRCAGCGQRLFDAGDKFESGTGWPSFTRPLGEESVETRTDAGLGTLRTEVHCARCGGHLGHVFPDGPAPTGLRYCINSVSLKLAATKPLPP